MFFTKELTYKVTAYTKLLIYKQARYYLLFFKLMPADYKINDWCLKNTGLSLQLICLYKILPDIKIDKGEANELVITFRSKKIEQLAQLITYGNGIIPGSTILQKAFLQR